MISFFPADLNEKVLNVCFIIGGNILKLQKKILSI